MSRSLLGSLVPWAPLVCAVLTIVSAAGSGCNTSCDDGTEGEPERVTDGRTDASLSVYESSPWNGQYRKFPPKKRYDFVHGLSGTPRIVQTFVAFTETPLGDDGEGNVSEAAGNEVIIEAVNSELIRVRNDTCETFYLRVAASSPDDDADAAPSGDAGAGGTSN